MRLRNYLKGLGLGMAVTALLLHFGVHAAEPSITDEEVIARARELGMIENVVLSRNDPTINVPADDAPASDGSSVSDGNAGTASGNEAADDGGGTDADGDMPEDGGSQTDAPSGSITDADTGNDDSGADASGHGDVTGTAENESASAGEPSEEEILPAAGNQDEVETELQEGMSGAEAGQDSSVTITVSNGDSSVSVAGRLASLGLVSSQAEYDAYLCSHGYDRTIRTGVHVIPAGATYQQIAEIITSKQ